MAHLTYPKRESEWTPGVGDGQGGLACCDSWGRKESDMTEWLIWSDLIWCINLLLPFPTLARILSYTGRRRVYSWGKDLRLTSKGRLICWLHLLFLAKMSEPILNSRKPVAWMEWQSGPILVSLPSWQQGVKWPSLCDQMGACPDSVFWGTASLDEPRASGNHQKQDDNAYFSA